MHWEIAERGTHQPIEATIGGASGRDPRIGLSFKETTQKNLGTSRSVTLRARFQFGTRGAESTTNRRELDDERLEKLPTSFGATPNNVLFEINLFRVRKMIKFEYSSE